ncbi:DUF3618 domain-containing protein [Planctomonas psychrotolerans]|uniref:DUF3618 domain-containing protein n=1 Tax=Planctomonas psychrotolerans TaxID=2528712 RepID=UPI001D0D0718|nr:DUF3618 domain-containing protein [Planctomonas psychrotolerans]
MASHDSSQPDTGKPDAELGMSRLKLEASVAREELAQTLDAIEDKLNVPAKAKQVWRGVKHQYREDPGPVLATAGVTAAALVSAVAFLVRIRRG